MTVFDLLLILLVLATVGCVVTVLTALVFHRWALAGRCFASIAAAWAIYLGFGAAVAIEAPQHIVRLGEDRCFDEMCFAVTGWNRTSSTNAGKSFYPVYVRFSNRS